MSPIIDKQMRFVELGRLRMGSKGDKGQPQKLSTWRLTSASRQLLDGAAAIYGGEVRSWQGAPNEGYFELLTDAAEIDVTIPPIENPGALLSQWYELWSAGGCARRCDGVTEGVSGKPCLCNPEKRECKTVTRMSVMLPRLPGVGVWRLDSGGENAAIELPGTFQFLAGVGGGRFIEATLRIEQRVKKVPGEGTRRFTVPVLNVPGATVGELMEASGSVGVIGPAQPPVRKPELPPAPAPSGAGFDRDDVDDFGERPQLPAAATIEIVEPAAPKPTAPQKKKLDTLVGQLREAGHLSTAQLYAALAKERSVDADTMIAVLEGRDEEGVLHWAPLRDSLTKAEATALIDRLTGLETRVGAPA